MRQRWVHHDEQGQLVLARITPVHGSIVRRPLTRLERILWWLIRYKPHA